MNEDLKKQLETAQAFITRLQAKGQSAQEEIGALDVEITAGLLADPELIWNDQKVNELIQHHIVSTHLANRIDAVLMTARSKVTELQQEAQRQELAITGMEQELADMARQHEALVSAVDRSRYEEILTSRASGLSINLASADEEAALRQRFMDQQALTTKMDGHRQRIAQLRKSLGVRP